ncbi:MAG: phage protease [Betaproteobacteria bacterium]|nr:phage protease [Betaproteobacteria bacterium]
MLGTLPGMNTVNSTPDLAATPFVKGASELSVAAHLYEMPEWEPGNDLTQVHLIPAGNFTGRDGRGPNFLDAEAVTNAFTAMGMSLAIDYEHQSIHTANNGQPAPAAGWITAIEAREDGLWGTVEWTDKAAEMIKEREYRYLSPVFKYEINTGRVIALVGAGLTNHPNLHLTAINRALLTDASLSTSIHTKGNQMEDILERLRYFIGLPITATEKEIAGELEKLIAMLSAPETAAMRQSLSLPDDARLPQVMTSLTDGNFMNAMKAAAHKADFVPRTELDRVMKAHSTLAKTHADFVDKVNAEQLEVAIQAAKKAGILPPCSEDFVRDEYRNNPEGFARYIAAQPVVVSTAAHTNKGAPAAAVNPLLADAERRAR